MSTQHYRHTHCQVAPADPQAKTWQRVCLFLTKKIELKKISHPSENKKHATTQTNRTQKITVELNNDNGLQTQWTSTPAGNSGFASCGVTVVNSSAVFQVNFSAGLTVLLKSRTNAKPQNVTGKLIKMKENNG